MMSQNKIKIFISGSNGFIGNYVKKTLIKNFDLLTPSKKKLNLNKRNILKDYFNKNKPDVVIHLAASTKFKLKKKDEKQNQIKNTFNTTKNLVTSINPECKLIVFFGSIEEYGNIKCPFKEDHHVKPITYYGKYKYKSYLYVLKYLKKKNLNYIWLRPSLTYGYGDNKERFLGHIINSIKKKEFFIIKPGEQKRDYIHIDDLCKVLELIVKNYKKKFNCILNISAQNYVKIRLIPKLIEKIIQQKVKYVFKRPDTKEINLCSSNRRLKNLFPNLKFISFRKGLIKTLKDESIL
jgi:nucleoside-diphosphate-sugar epimerase